MSKLAARSFLVIVQLFGMVFAVGAGVLYHYDFPVSWAIGWTVLIVTLQYAISPFIIDAIFKISWIRPEEISPAFAEYLSALCKKRGIPVPRFGVIEDGNPNAFTYGHTVKNARLVVTRGLQQMLDEEEFNAVVAHEVGHISHNDFIVMTFVALVPMLLYTIYCWTRSRRRETSAIAISVGAYLAYIVSQYIVLFLSRIREYFADEHAAQSVDNANAISTALIKIAYGLAVISREEEKDKKGRKKEPSVSKGMMIGSMGICSLASASSMAMYSVDASGRFSTDTMMKAMQWDLWNPWAKFFEFQCTHPLVARRVLAASKVACSRGQTPFVSSQAQPDKSYWPEFQRDLLFLLMPWIGLVVGLIADGMLASNGFLLSHTIGSVQFGIGRYVLLLTGLGWMMRLAASFAMDFKPARIADLVGEVDVSHIHSIPVEITGKIIGRGIPGIFWSKDLVIQDQSGFVTLIYRQPLSFLETLFGLFKAGGYEGRMCTIRGWYRRGPAPYVELDEAEFADGSKFHCHRKAALWAMSMLVTLVGTIVALTGFHF